MSLPAGVTREVAAKAVGRVLRAILETVAEYREAPEGIIYAALQMSGFPGGSRGLEVFELMMQELEKREFVTRSNHLITATEKGISFAKQGG